MADTHIPRRALTLPLPVLKGFQGVDLIIHAGDLVSRKVIKELEALAPLEAVAGNHDEKKFGCRLPKGKTIQVDGVTIGITHGGKNRDDYPVAGTIAREYFCKSKPDIIIYGHTHQPQVTYDGKTVLLNPGSPTDNRHGFPNSFARLIIAPQLVIELVFFKKIKNEYRIQTQMITFDLAKK
ncbi:MAG: metallophosphoesterase [Clostridia bacterium]|nr:metallophosphoesterase [Clostridia bacterium]